MGSFISVWLTWWLGDLAGALVAAPVVVLWAKSEPASLTPPQITGTGLTYLAAVAVGVIVFGCPVMHHIPVHEALGFHHFACFDRIGAPRLRNRGAYYFRIRGLVHRNAMRALRQAKPE